MPIRNTATAWGWPARLLHWAMAILIVFMLSLGVSMANFVDDLATRFVLTQTHKSFGFVVISLALVRVSWRLMNPLSPAAPAAARRWENRLAHATHVALYVLMFLMPLSGWLMASASDLQDMYGIRNMVFGLFEMPDPFVPGDRRLEQTLKLVHVSGATVLSLLLVLHAGAALKHHFVLRDDVLTRMSLGRAHPLGRRRTLSPRRPPSRR